MITDDLGPPEGVAPCMTRLEPHGSGGLRLRAEGEIDISVGDGLRDAILDAAAQQPTELLLDLAAVTFLDVSGVRAIEDSVRRCAALGIRVVMGPASAPVRRVLDLLEITPSLPWTPSG